MGRALAYLESHPVVTRGYVKIFYVAQSFPCIESGRDSGAYSLYEFHKRLRTVFAQLDWNVVYAGSMASAEGAETDWALVLDANLIPLEAFSGFCKLFATHRLLWKGSMTLPLTSSVEQLARLCQHSRVKSSKIMDAMTPKCLESKDTQEQCFMC